MTPDLTIERHGLLPAAPPTGVVSRRLLSPDGHLPAYIGLLLFTFDAYVKPQNFTPPPNIALALAALTLLAYLPEQLKLEGRLTARPPELTLLWLFCLTAILSMPLAQSRSDAWAEFNDMFIKEVVMFMVIINVVRTEKRLQGLLWMAVGIAVLCGVSTLHNYRTGQGTLEGYRATGILGGILIDPNDMSLFIVSILPIAIALLLGYRSTVAKVLLGLCALVMVAGIVVTFSRGGFVALVGVVLVLTFKFGRRQPMVAPLVVLGLLGFFVLAPGNYGGRLASIANPSLDETGAAAERRDLLLQSVQETINHPLFGLGIGNFHMVTDRDKPTHNAYTQVSSEMGIPALIFYGLFMVVPLLELRRMERETFGVPAYSRLYFLAVGLQASLIGYMIGSFFLSVAFYWFIYYLVGYAVCLRRIYETGPGRIVGGFAFLPQEVALRDHA